MIDFDRFRVLTFDCYGTLIDWETGIAELVRPWIAQMDGAIPVDLVMTSFAVHQAKHQQVRPALLYPKVMARAWRDIEGTFGWDENADHAEAFAASAGDWPPFADTVESLRYLSRFYKLAILSNVDNASLKRTFRLLEVPFTLTVTAEDVGSYKPGLPHFQRAFDELGRLGFAKDEILHVAQSKHHDVVPGRQLGLTTVWVNRRHDRKGSGATLATEAEPHLTVTSLAELVALHKSRSRIAATG
jgi:2-haloacid dehalogenase/putative hydrolase of the HAD superfamily